MNLRNVIIMRGMSGQRLLAWIIPVRGVTSDHDLYQASLFLEGIMACFTVAVLVWSLRKLLRRQTRSWVHLVCVILPVYQLLLLTIYLQSRRQIDRTALYGGALIVLLNILIYFVLVHFLDERMEKRRWRNGWRPFTPRGRRRWIM